MTYETMNLNELAEEFIKFSIPAFPKADALVSIQKLKDETKELEHEVKNLNLFIDISCETTLDEYVDCFMCLLHSMARAGFNVDMFTEAFVKKLIKNKNRVWKENKNGTYSHVKKGDL